MCWLDWPDSQRYFDHHHAATDILDAVNKRELELGAATLTSLIYLYDTYWSCWGIAFRRPNNPTDLNLTAYTKEFSYNLKLSYPVIIGMLGHTFVQFIDNVMVGQLGTAELAAISLGNSFIFIAMSVGIGFSTAITPLVAEETQPNVQKRSSRFSIMVCYAVLFGLGSVFIGLSFTEFDVFYGSAR